MLTLIRPAFKSVFLWFLAILVFTACSRSEQPSKKPEGQVEIRSAVMAVLPPGMRTGAIYLELKNNTDQTLILNHIHSPVSDHIEVHRNFYEDGVMKMRPVTHVSVPAGGKMQFAPGGYHLMIFDMDPIPQQGAEFDLTAEFESGIVVTGSVAVKRL